VQRSADWNVWQRAGRGSSAVTLQAHLPAAFLPEQAQEQYDQPEEQYNEAGDPIMPFSLGQELSVSSGTERACRCLGSAQIHHHRCRINKE
jgi:hypothetical protein